MSLRHRSLYFLTSVTFYFLPLPTRPSYSANQVESQPNFFWPCRGSVWHDTHRLAYHACLHNCVSSFFQIKSNGVVGSSCSEHSRGSCKRHNPLDYLQTRLDLWRRSIVQELHDTMWYYSLSYFYL